MNRFVSKHQKGFLSNILSTILVTEIPGSNSNVEWKQDQKGEKMFQGIKLSTTETMQFCRASYSTDNIPIFALP